MKKLKIGLYLFLAAVFLGAICLFAACNGETDGYDNDFGEAGEYYCEIGGREYLFTLTGKEFSVTLGNKTGKYVFDGAVLSLTFSDGSTGSATLADNAVTYAYGGQTYLFLLKRNFTVSFITDGGGDVAAQSVLNGKTASRPQDPQKAGQVFIGWYLGASSGAAYDFDEPVRGDVTLYARYAQRGEEEFTVSFVTDGGGEFADVQTVGGVLYDLPQPSREGSEFVGWWTSDYENADKLTRRYNAGDRLYENATLFAVYAGGVALSVSDGDIVWTSAGAGKSYAVTVFTDDGTAVYARTVGRLSSDYRFPDAGDYVVTVTVDGQTYSAYYRHKKLNRVSLFAVEEPSALRFNAVDNATSYTLTFALKEGDKTFDLGQNTTFDLTTTEIPAGGVSVTVTASAEGFVSSLSAPYRLVHDLSPVAGLQIADDVASWQAVPYAERYEISVTSGEETHTYAAEEPSFALDFLDKGAYTVTVTAKARGFAESFAAVSFDKGTLATPTALTIQGNAVVWNAVAQAEGYRVRVGDHTYDVAENNIAFSVFLPDIAGGSTVAFTVTALGEGDVASAPSKPLEFADGLVSVVYENGFVRWNYVLGATAYFVTAEGKDVPTGEDLSARVTFTSAGEKTVTVAFADAEGQRSADVTLKVTVSDISFRSDGAVVAHQYAAEGDAIAFPQPKKTGYTLTGWTAAGKPFDDSRFDGKNDVTLDAAWQADRIEVTLDADGGVVSAEKTTVEYDASFALPVPTIADEDYRFRGWFTEKEGKGTQLTDETGRSVAVWSRAENVTVFAWWSEKDVAFTLNADGASYTASKGPSAAKFDTLTIPATYNGLPVTVVEDFQNLTTLKAVYIPDTVLVIETSTAFIGCTALQGIHIVPTAKSANERGPYASEAGVLIYDNAFNGKELKAVPAAYPLDNGTFRVPDGVTTLPLNVFAAMPLTKVVIPASVVAIDQHAFYLCDKLSDVVFEEGGDALAVRSLAFQGCTSLTSVTLPARLAALATDAFAACNKLAALHVDGAASNQVFTSADGVLIYRASTVYLCPIGRSTAYAVPSGIATIGEEAFASCRLLPEITVHESVTSIARYAFLNCVALTTVNFSDYGADNRLEIAESAFYGCESLTGIALPARLVSVGSYAFAGCTSLTSVTLPQNLSVLREYAFAGCTSLQSATVNSANLSDFADGAFASANGVTYLKHLILAASAGASGNVSGIFGGVTLESVTVEEGNQHYATNADGVLYDKNITAILYYPIAKTGEYVLPDSVVTVSAHALENRRVTAVSLGEKVQTIGEYAFSGCTQLTTLTVAGGSRALTVDKYAFAGTALTSVTLPERVVSLGEGAFSGCASLTDVVLSEGLTSIGAYAFTDCVRLTSFTVPASVSSMGGRRQFTVFDGCERLAEIVVASGSTSYLVRDGVLYATNADGAAVTLCYSPVLNAGEVTIPATVTSVLAQAFYGNKGVTSVKTAENPAATCALGDLAFYGMTALTEAVLPNVTEIGENMFLRCDALERVSLPKTVVRVGNNAFAQLKKLKTVIFEDGGSALTLDDGEYSGAFYYCIALETVVLPELSVGSAYNFKIGDFSFYGCSALREINFKSPVTAMGYGVFYGCTALEKVTFSDASHNTQFALGNDAFRDTTSLSEIVLPSNMHKIGIEAFSGSALTTVTIGSGVTAIDEKAFYNCKKLQTVTFGAKVATIGASAFENCVALTAAAFPASVSRIDEKAFKGCIALTQATFASGSVLSEIGAYAFSGTSLSSFVFPEVTSGNITLGRALFADCTALSSVYLSSSVRTVDKVFLNCASVGQVTVSPDSLFVAEGGVLLNKAGTELVLAYGAVSGSYTVPEGVTAIGAGAFSYRTGITKIVVPSSVTTVGESAFAYCADLQTVEFAEGSLLESIGDNAFSGSGIERIVLPEGITALGNGIFAYCEKLSNVAFGGELTSIGGSAFRGCTSLTAFVFPETVTYVGVRAFSGSGLVSVTLPAGMKILGNGTAEKDNSQYGTPSWVFADCQDLKTVTLPDGLEIIGANTFENCLSLQSITLPDTVKMLGSYCFAGSGLTSIVLPASLTSLVGQVNSLSSLDIAVEAGIFMNCRDLASVTLHSGVTKLGMSTFRGCVSLKSISLPSVMSDNAFGRYVFAESGLTSIVLPNGATLYESAFEGCRDLKTVTAGGSVRAENRAFKNCVSLTDINISAMTKIGDEAFYGCSSLEKVSFGTNFSAIGTRAFYGTAVRTIVLPTRIPTTSEGIFENCALLTSLTLPEGVTSIGNSWFKDCVSLASVTLPASLTNIGYSAFQNTGITSVNIPANTDEISDYAFAFCPYLSSVTLPEGFLRIRGGAFRDCVALESITLPDSLLYIADLAFNGTGLKEVVIPERTGLIGDGAFGGCLFLTSFTVMRGNAAYRTEEDGAVYNYDNQLVAYPAGKSGTYFLSADADIARGAFYGCAELTFTFDERTTVIRSGLFYGLGVSSFIVPEGIERIEANAFAECTNLQSVTLPSTLKYIGDGAFRGCMKLKEINLPEGLTVIGSGAFRYDVALESITLPSTVQQIGSYAFDGCSGLTEVVIREGVTALGDKENGSLFRNCTSVSALYIPSSVTATGEKILENWTDEQTVRVAYESFLLPAGWHSDWAEDSDAAIVYGYVAEEP